MKPDQEPAHWGADKMGNGIMSRIHIPGNGQEAGKQQTHSLFLPAWPVLLPEPELDVRKRT